MNDAERRFETVVRRLVEVAAADEVPGADELLDAQVATFESEGVLTRNAGLVVRLEDGSTFQLTIVQSERGRRLGEMAPGEDAP